MLDFTSSLYLGFAHASHELEPWAQLTTGLPAALGTSPAELQLERSLAGLIAAERALVGPSTLHLFWDLFDILSRRPIAIYIDNRSYPIARWGIERAVARGVRVRSFAHQSAGHLDELLRRDDATGRLPVVVSDGLCARCGCIAPVARYLESLRPRSGLLVIDDTQSLGILGRSASTRAPYGHGGCGSLSWHGLEQVGADVLVVSSMAKAFGAPLAVIASNNHLIKLFERESQTRIHSSPPSIAAIRAAAHALKLNQAVGDVYRARLLRNVRRFRRAMDSAGLSAEGGLFPQQSVDAGDSVRASALHARLDAAGIRTVLRSDYRISLLITARHSVDDIDRAAETLLSLTRKLGRAGDLVR